MTSTAAGTKTSTAAGNHVSDGVSVGGGDKLDSLETLLRQRPQVQEKIYLHLDNNCYFVGDTLWYKAYVVRSDNLQPTNLSKLLYVELLSPDGIVVERQHVVIANKGMTCCGQFVLTDSLYSGYYEVRAYTKYNLNFNVTEKPYTFVDERRFFNKQLCKDYFRDFEGLYSRVVPVYQKPTEQGNYSQRFMSRRPKQHLLKDKPKLLATFYPEGGTSVEGVPCRIAFEMKDQNGQGINLEGTLTNGQKIQSTYLGRGTFTYTPTSDRQHATFQWNGKEYSFRLPEAQKTGTTISYDPEKQSFTLHSTATTPAAYAILCRGKLIDFQRINGDNTFTLSTTQHPTPITPTGINEVIIYDNDAQPLCSRLFFINNHDLGKRLDIQLTDKSGTIGKTTTLPAYDKLDLTVNAPSGQLPSTVSIAIRDTQTDDPAYDDGNIMTDLLLGSELKGFVASPAYYFQSDDEQHRQRLDELMMIQGWRRYARVDKIRYMPELTTTFEGTVYKLLSTTSMLELEDMEKMMTSTNIAEEEMNKLEEVIQYVSSEETTTDETSISTDTDTDTDTDDSSTAISNDPLSATYEYTEGKASRKAICVEAELTKLLDESKTQSAGAITRTDKNGHFSIKIPPYYDKAFLFVKAYAAKDSAEKCMAALQDKHWMDETSYPDYFVKRDMFFPIYSKPYSWYQINSPDLFFIDEDDDQAIPENSKLAGNHTLQTVIVKARRRGKRAIDWAKPALVRDAYDLYNDVTDYGLSFGVLDMRVFPQQAADYLFGNMGRNTQFNIRAMVDGTSFFRNYTPGVSEYDKNMASTKMYEYMHLNRLKDIRIFTDYEMRVDSGDVRETNNADVTMDFVPVPDDGKRYTYRDRRYVFPGITYPEEFYSPDYSAATPSDPKDYRRTLYWNPNAPLSADGTFHATLYNNSRETRVTVSAAAIDASGQMYW